MPLAVVDAQWHCEEEEVFGRLHAEVVAGFDLSLVERQCEVVAVRRRRLVSEQQQAAASRRSNAQRHVIRRLSGMSANKNNNNNNDDVSSVSCSLLGDAVVVFVRSVAIELDGESGVVQ